MTMVSIDSATFRKAMAQYASGLTIIAAMVDGKPAGFTCQSFHSVSLEPTLVSFNVAKTSKSWPVIRSASNFSINVLSAAQMGTSQAFGRSDVDRWEHAAWGIGPEGAPHLTDSMLCLDCTIHAEHDAGDHVIVVARVNGITDPTQGTPRDPLLFFRGRYHGVASL